jgi:hypothetical protein
MLSAIIIPYPSVSGHLVGCHVLEQKFCRVAKPGHRDEISGAFLKDALHDLKRSHSSYQDEWQAELRDDVDGTPVTPEQARAIIAERYTVPEEVRQRNNRRAQETRRTARRAQMAETIEKKKGKPPKIVRGEPSLPQAWVNFPSA